MFKGSLVLTAGNNPIPNKGVEPKNCDFGGRVLAGVLRPRGRSTSSVTRIELPRPRLRRPKSTTSETCSHRELVSVRFAATRYTKNSLQTIKLLGEQGIPYFAT